jgi:hypothetical protein
MTLSLHACRRAQQRGITTAQLLAVTTYGDMEVHRGGNCYAVWISKRALQRLGPSTPEGVPTDRLKDLTILEGADALVTAFRNARRNTYRRAARRASR